jgi:hypothetical protein
MEMYSIIESTIGKIDEISTDDEREKDIEKSINVQDV